VYNLFCWYNQNDQAGWEIFMTQVKILIVEDELLIAKGLARKLEKLGYQIIDTVSSGEMVLETLLKQKPDLILMDIVIKGDMDGIDTARKVNQLYQIPVIYLTAYADDQTLARAEGTGSYGYILKPFNERELHATIKIALQKHKQDKEIRQSLSESQILNTEQSRYLSIASHELRNPITAIQMSAEMLEKYEDNLSEDKKHKHLDRIRKAASNMNQLLEDVLILSRADLGKLSFHPTPLDVIEFCHNLVEDFQINLGQEYQILLQYQGYFNQVYLDSNLLSHILNNLISNAVKYSPDGGIIQLLLIGADELIIFKVIDHGIGMPAEFQANLFKQFERATNVGNIQGTGLGLSIVKRAVDLHNGQIAVESEEGEGTTFTVILPCGLVETTVSV
jgi:signal transduction histidine kinase